MFKLIITTVFFAISFPAFASDVSRVKCGDINAVIVQHQPGSFVAMGATKFELDEYMDYYGPYCLMVEGVPHIGYLETSGNSYEGYYLGNTQTKRLYEINYEAAVEVGLSSEIKTERD